MLKEIFEAASQGSFGGKKLKNVIQKKEALIKSKESNISDNENEEKNLQVNSPKPKKDQSY